MEERIRRLEKMVEALGDRNWRVEADKAWETSYLRIGAITLATYAVAAVALALIGAQSFLLGALVPAAGFFLSTQSLPVVKRRWVRKFMRQKNQTSR